MNQVRRAPVTATGSARDHLGAERGHPQPGLSPGTGCDWAWSLFPDLCKQSSRRSLRAYDVRGRAGPLCVVQLYKLYEFVFVCSVHLVRARITRISCYACAARTRTHEGLATINRNSRKRVAILSSVSMRDRSQFTSTASHSPLRAFLFVALAELCSLPTRRSHAGAQDQAGERDTKTLANIEEVLFKIRCG